jgi:hypothetical protein
VVRRRDREEDGVAARELASAARVRDRHLARHRARGSDHAHELLDRGVEERRPRAERLGELRALEQDAERVVDQVRGRLVAAE